MPACLCCVLVLRAAAPHAVFYGVIICSFYAASRHIGSKQLISAPAEAMSALRELAKQSRGRLVNQAQPQHTAHTCSQAEA